MRHLPPEAVILLTVTPLLFGATAFAEVGDGHPVGAETVIGSYRGGTVPADRFASWLRHRNAEDDVSERARELEEMVLVESLAELAHEHGLDETPEARPVPESLEERQLASALRTHRREQVAVTEAEVDEAMAGRPDFLEKPPRVRLRTLFKRLPPGHDAQTRAALRQSVEALRSRVLDGADFAQLAATESDSQARFRKGLVGNVEPGQLAPEIEAIALALQPGETSEVIETDRGFSLFYCESHLPARRRTVEEARELTAVVLTKRKVKKDWEDHLQSLVEGVDPQFAEPSPDRPPRVLLRYSGGEITLADVRISRLVAGVPLPENPHPETLRTAATRVLEVRLAAREARELELDQDPDLLEGLEWRKKTWLATLELARRVGERVEAPSQEAVRSYFEGNRARFAVPQRFDISVILLLATAEDLPARYEEALELRRRIVEGELDFATAALDHSDHRSQSEGGRIDSIERPKMAGLGRNVFNTIIELEPGEVSLLVQQDLGLWIVKLHGSEPRRFLIFEEARGAVEAELGNKIAEQEREAILAEIRRELSVELLPQPRLPQGGGQILDQ